MLRRKGLTEKYDCAGVYCIKLNGEIVYIGKSLNMLERIAAHYVGIKKRANSNIASFQKFSAKAKLWNLMFSTMPKARNTMTSSTRSAKKKANSSENIVLC